MGIVGRARAIFRRDPILSSGFLIAAAIALFFFVRLVIGLFSWEAPEDEEIRPWMTVGYIGRSWELDPRAIDAAAGLPLPEERPSEPRPYTLREIADERGVPVEEIIRQVYDAIATLRAAPPPAGPGGGPP